MREGFPHLVQTPDPPQRLALFVQVKSGDLGPQNHALEAIDVLLRLGVLVLVHGEHVDPNR
eukprot:8987867-Pyramimonas_sp.AAC.1